jgi:hypothetical protein
MIRFVILLLAGFGAYTLYKMYEGLSPARTRSPDEFRNEMTLGHAPDISAEKN